MIEQLNTLLKGNKDGVAIKFRPTGGKWHSAKLIAADAQGVALIWPNEAQGFMPWHGIAVMNIDTGEAPKGGAKAPAAKKPAAAKAN